MTAVDGNVPGQNPGEVVQTPVPVDPNIEIVGDANAVADLMLLAGIDADVLAELAHTQDST